MNARTYLIYGLLAGLIAGLAAFFVGHQIGEPHVDAAIAVEEAHSAAEEATMTDDAAAGHTHEEDGTVVSRENQSTWGLLTGTLAAGTALGGIVGLAAAFAAGRLGRLRASQTTAVIAAVGFLSVSVVPFLKYPATPPAVGNPDTIGERTGLYFTFMLISVLAAILAVLVVRQLTPSRGIYQAIVAGTVIYLAIVVVAGMVMPTVNEIGDFPADTLWYFRRASLLTLTTVWAVIGFVLVGLVGRAEARQRAAITRPTVAATV